MLRRHDHFYRPFGNNDILLVHNDNDDGDVIISTTMTTQ